MCYECGKAGRKCEQAYHNATYEEYLRCVCVCVCVCCVCVCVCSVAHKLGCWCVGRKKPLSYKGRA